MLHPLMQREASCRIANLSARRCSPNTVRALHRRFLSSTRPNTASSIRLNATKTASPLRLSFRPIRHDSTLAAGGHAAPAPPPQLSNGLTWNRFLELRKIRRRISLISSVLFGIGSMVAGGAFVLSNELEVKVSQTVGIDQFITLGALFIICFAGGWLIGPFFGNALFNFRFRSMRKMIAEVSGSVVGFRGSANTRGRRRRSSSPASRRTGSIRRRDLTAIPSRITTERRLEACVIIDVGSRTSGRLT
jgi:hypothetical protein